MMVLVDYDNVTREDRRMGVHSLIETIVRLFSADLLLQEQRLEFRLYGGWYNDRHFTRMAQSLAVELHRAFPCKFLISGKVGNVRVSTTAELAYSIAARPEKHLFATYRYRGQVKGRVICHPASRVGCTRSGCAMAPVEEFFRKQACPLPECHLAADDFLSRSEQKLVDAMLITDLLHYAKIGHQRIALVSSDDDFWPAIISAVSGGTEILHVHTKDSSPASSFYVTGLPKHYLTVKL
jgi:uncharacterized LabA/DUF88 family protein